MDQGELSKTRVGHEHQSKNKSVHVLLYSSSRSRVSWNLGLHFLKNDPDHTFCLAHRDVETPLPQAVEVAMLPAQQGHLA